MKFRYEGAFQARKIEEKGETVFDGNFVPEKTYDLPDENKELETMIASGLLVPMDEEVQKEKLPSVIKKKEAK